MKNSIYCINLYYKFDTEFQPGLLNHVYLFKNVISSEETLKKKKCSTVVRRDAIYVGKQTILAFFIN